MTLIVSNAGGSRFANSMPRKSDEECAKKDESTKSYFTRLFFINEGCRDWCRPPDPYCTLLPVVYSDYPAFPAEREVPGRILKVMKVGSWS